MGWTIVYRARSTEDDIDAFVADANRAAPKLSLGSEPYRWEKHGESRAIGFTKLQFSWRKRRDFVRIIDALKSLAERWTHVRVDAGDDHVLGGWWHVRNIRLDKLDL